MQSLIRSNLSEDAAEKIRDMISNGTLPANTRINEVHLAEALGVSRTPLREALAALVSEGALEHIPRRGTFVRPLTRAEFEALYAIRPLLDVEALRLSGLPDRETLEALTALNERMRDAKTVQARIARDDEWHLKLIERCGNPVLLDLIRQFMFKTRRYEIAYLKAAEHLDTAYEEHASILRALEDGTLEAACAGLNQNLTSGIEPILVWLDGRDEDA